jgi:hypothetical protein
MTLTDIALRINEHLQRFAADPAIAQRECTDRKGNSYTYSIYWNTHAWRGGSRVMVKYVSYQGTSSLTREQAIKYLKWLDDGNVGRHFEVERGLP